MSFEAFNNDDIQKMLDYTLKNMSEEALAEQVKKYGGIKYREYLAAGFKNEQAVAEVIKWYGGKEKVMEAVLQSTGNEEELKQQQDKNAEIYKQFVIAKETDNVDLAKEYLESKKLTEVTDSQYGIGSAEYIAKAIQCYYGA